MCNRYKKLEEKLLDGRFWIERGYILPDYRFDSFIPGSRVLDIGCGFGDELEDVINKGACAIGVDISKEALISCYDKGLPVIYALAEKLPFRNNSFDGVICKAVLPYLHEVELASEIARVLRLDGQVELCTHGLGHYVLLCLYSRHGYWKWPIINTWRYILLGKWRGEMYQSKRRLERYLKENNLEIEKYTPSKSFLGMPVFLYYRLKKVEKY